MKKSVIFGAVLGVVLALNGMAFGDPMDELLGQYTREFEAVKPPPNSSVNTDYKFDQIAMSGLYTTRTLGLIWRQNQEVMAKQEEVLRKYDRVIEQNQEIIRLLTVISKQGQGTGQ